MHGEAVNTRPHPFGYAHNGKPFPVDGLHLGAPLQPYQGCSLCDAQMMTMQYADFAQEKQVGLHMPIPLCLTGQQTKPPL